MRSPAILPESSSFGGCPGKKSKKERSKRGVMNTSLLVTEDLFTAFLKCRYKAYLKYTGTVGEPSEYEQLEANLAAEYQTAARQKWLGSLGKRTAVQAPPSLLDAIRGGADLILNVSVRDADQACHLDALERCGGKTGAASGLYTPVLFTPHERVAPDDRLRLAFERRARE
jgi:hypothetical protein